ncbi:hypothetical protein [Streptococcus zalophi]|uniref:hypothetical protein n=1 Tax=Streptococcus zalophi TaxID=640031 RepID=UPI00215D08F0|nr:hypothetical protein [Streptococcus zalophi]MCR8968287.1 hypothetical protein [Streptococcus zalophi]
MKKSLLILTISAFSLMLSSPILADESTNNQPETSTEKIIDNSNAVATFTGFEYEGLPNELIVGQTGQMKRPSNHYLANTNYSFTIESSDTSVLNFSDKGEWQALKPGTVTVKFHLTDPQTNPKFKEELEVLSLSTNWLINEIAMEPLTITVHANTNAMNRLYNPNSGEHFYTASTGEKNYLVTLGWRFEGIGWSAPISGNPVYRLYNPNNGDHHYTTSKGENDYLVKVGWRSENIGWQSGGDIPVYRLYNPNAKGAGSHHYTTSKGEANFLERIGWNYEGIGWYAER